MTTISPFTLSAVAAMRHLYPETLADRSFDNTGLLLEAPLNSHRKKPLRNRVLLAIDLTTAVADEAIRNQVSLVVAYHPIIFRGLKSITMADSQQRTLLRLAGEGISVYSPHTAIDAADGGNADWLANMVAGRYPQRHTNLQQSSGSGDATSTVIETAAETPGRARYVWRDFPKLREIDPSQYLSTTHTRHPIISSSPPHPSHPNAGMGRLLTFNTPQPLSALLNNLITNFCNPAALKVALPEGRNTAAPLDPNELPVRRVAVCAGSGSSTFYQLKEPVELLVTGEMSHHEVLAATERGVAVVCLEHSNSERGYLRMVMQGKLEGALRGEWKDAEVAVSKVDRDPFGVLCPVG